MNDTWDGRRCLTGTGLSKTGHQPTTTDRYERPAKTEHKAVGKKRERAAAKRQTRAVSECADVELIEVPRGRKLQKR